MALSKWAGANEPRKSSELPKTMTIQTVLGPIPVAAFGFALPHEHIMCDFIGAQETNRARWNIDEVTAAMLPPLLQLKERGVSGFVDCTGATRVCCANLRKQAGCTL
jgi:phosphotriesterase-related protein